MSGGGRRWKPPPVVIVISSDEEEEEPPKKKKQKKEEPPKRKRQAPTSGKRQLTLQLSQSQPASSSQPEVALSQGNDAAAMPPPPPRLGVAALMGPSKQRPEAASAAAPTVGELWVDKHAPNSEPELVVHKKKVAEVRQWLDWQWESLGRSGVGRVAVMTGPPGCGKSAVLRVLAAAAGFEPCEWQPPTPTLWNEYQLQAGSGGKYVSKLDAFEEFSLRAKLPALSLSKSQPAGDGDGLAAGPSSAPSPSQQPPLPHSQQQQQQQQSQQAQQVRQPASSSQQPPGASQREPGGTGAGAAGGQRPKLLIVDDLPHAANPEQRQRLAAALGDLARTTRFPLVVMATETSGRAQQERGLSAAAGTYQGLHKDLIAALESAQATSFSFNPITAANTAKALWAILEREKASLSDAEVQAIAEQAQGDLYNAISTLQFVCTGVKPSAVPVPARKGRGAKRKAAPAAASDKAASQRQQQQKEKERQGSAAAYASRDSTLTMFHALGKLLYNKRVEAASGEGQEAAGAPQKKKRGSSSKATAAAPAGSLGASPNSGEGSAGPPLAEWCRRPPLDFDPEAVIAQSGLDTGSVAAYLHENLHNFVDAAAVEDMAGCLAYLSQADVIAGGFRYGGGGVTLVDDELPSTTLAEAAAASTAARGVCFSNAHPAPRRWLPLSAPAAFLVERAARQNREQLQQGVAGAWALHGAAGHLASTRTLACELLPFVRSMHSSSHDPRLLDLQPSRWCRIWEGQLYDGGGGGGAVGSGAGFGGAAEVDGQEGAGGSAEDAIEDSEGEEDDW